LKRLKSWADTSTGVVLLLAVLGGGSAPAGPFTPERNLHVRETLLDIYREVREMGFRAHEDFIKREFHFDLDGRRSNREEHVVVLSHREGAGDRMIVQVTLFEDFHGIARPRLACETLEIKSLVAGGDVEITRCDFDDSKLRDWLPAILDGIREEIELLRLVRR